MLDRLRFQPDDRFAFLQGFLRHPNVVGSVIPSSRFLERRIVDTAALADAHVVVELGPGTGGTTRAMLQKMPRDSKLLAIEMEPKFATLLESEPDPRLIVHRDSAVNLQQAIEIYGLSSPDVIVSGVPFSTMPRSVGRQILRAIWSSLAPGGRFVAYQLRDRVAVLGREIAGAPEVAAEFRNVPPMRVYCWRKPLPQKSPHAA